MEILEKLKSEYAKKALIYYFDRLFELGVGFVQTWIIGRKLGADGYGIFVTYMSITGIALIFFRAGFVSSAKYIIAHTDTEKARELIGASFVVALATGFLFGVFIFIFGLFADSIFNVKVGKLLLFSSPLLVGSILRNYISSWGEATGKIIPMSIFLFITKFFEFILIFLFFFVFKSKNLFLLVLSVIAPVWFTGLSFFFFLKPSFNLLKENILTLLRVNKEFGFRVYIGQVADLTTYRLDKVFLAYFGIAKTVGNYSLADSGMRVVVDFPASIASALFRGFAKSRIINPKV
ncbi:MAG: oligosaccharide flippase family protein, partial [bacterium]